MITFFMLLQMIYEGLAWKQMLFNFLNDVELYIPKLYAISFVFFVSSKI